MHDGSVTFRLCKDQILELDKLAKASKVDRSDLVRLFVEQGMRGTDKKHEELLRNFHVMKTDLEQNLVLTAGALAAAVLLIDRGIGTEEEAKALIKKQIKRSMGVGRSIKSMVSSGEFD